MNTFDFNNDKDEKKELNISFSTKDAKKKSLNFGKMKNGKISFFERLKEVSKRDIALMLVGVSILILAPVAEYFLSKPQPQGTLTTGFGDRKAASGSALYEPGVNALSAGSPEGGEEVIAPLTARDPASLILGVKKEEPPQLPPPPPFETKRDSLADIAKKSFQEAAKSSPAPFIPPKMQASLRGASSFFSGGEGSRTNYAFSSAKILNEAKSASAKAEKKSLIGAQGVPGYKGVASESKSVNKGAFEKLRTQADKAADFFSGSNAKQALEQAAAASVTPSAGGGFNSINDGGKNTNPSGSSLRGSFSFSPGDPCRGSIEAQIACDNAKKANDFKNWLKYDLVKDFIRQALADPVIKVFGDNVKGLLNPSNPPPPEYCWFNTKESRKASIKCFGEKQDDCYYKVDGVGLVGKKYEDYKGICKCGIGSSPNTLLESCSNNGQQASNGQQPNSQPTSGGNSSSGGVISLPSVSTPVVSKEIPNYLKEFLEEYDINLKEAARSVKLANEAKTIDDIKKIELDRKLIESVNKDLFLVQQIVSLNLNMANKKNPELLNYETSISTNEELAKGIELSYSNLIGKCDDNISYFKSVIDKINYRISKIKENCKKNPKEPCKITEKGEMVEISRIKNMISELERDKSEYTSNMNEVENYKKRIQSHKNAYIWYKNQFDNVKNLNKKIGENSGIEANEVKNINNIDLTNPESFKYLFKRLGGTDLPNLVVSSSVINSNNSNPRNAIADKNTNTIDLLILWRTADKNKVQKDDSDISDIQKIAEEIRLFIDYNPLNKFGTCSEHPCSFNDLPLKEESFILSAIRSENLYESLKNIKEDLNRIGEILKGKRNTLDKEVIPNNSKKIEGFKKEIEEICKKLGCNNSQNSSSSPHTPSTGTHPTNTHNQNQNTHHHPGHSHHSNTGQTSPSSQNLNQDVIKYQSLLNVYIDNIKKLRSKMKSLESEKNIAYNALQKCLNSWHIYSPLGCKKEENAFNNASQRFLDAINEFRQAKQNCEKFKSSVPVNIRNQLIGECN
jgi:hypothetical protein